MVWARAATAVLACELSFFCWSQQKRRALNVQARPYYDAEQPPSGTPFTKADRRRQVERLISSEFGDGATPERGRKFISGWFLDTPFEEIDREAARTFFTWAWFNHASTDALSPDEAKEVDADVARFEKLAGQPFSSTPPQRELQCMRPNVDNTFDLASHKPLLVYLLTELVVGTLMQRRLMSKLGFTRHTIGEGSASIAYWHRPAPSDAPPSNDAPPLILLHGIGISWRVGYPNLLQELVDTAGQDRGIIAPESPVVALTAPKDYGANPAESVKTIRSMLAAHGYGTSDGGQGRCDLLAHSYGTLTASHLLKQTPEMVRSAVLLDPVCVGAHRATLCRTFLYEPTESRAIVRSGSDPRQWGSILVQKIKLWLLHRDPRIVGALMRNFYWYDNVLWLDEDLDRKAPDKGDGKVSLFVAEGDRYIDGPIIYGDAKAAEAARARGLYGVRSKGRELRSVLWKGQDHGEFLSKPEQRRQVIESLLDV